MLTRRGFAVDPLGMTVTIAIGGAVLAVEPRYSPVLGDARFYALLLGVIGLATSCSQCSQARIFQTLRATRSSPIRSAHDG